MTEVLLKTGVFFLLVLAVAKPLGVFMARVFEGGKTFLDPVLVPVEKAIYRLAGVDPLRDQGWRAYGAAMLVFNVVTLVVLYAPPAHAGRSARSSIPTSSAAVPPALAWNTAVSFTTNTNWQAYSGETTMSHLTQMAGLAVHNFLSAATGIAIAVAFVRGIARTDSKGIGNFWRDLVRATLWVLLPISLVAGNRPDVAGRHPELPADARQSRRSRAPFRRSRAARSPHRRRSRCSGRTEAASSTRTPPTRTRTRRPSRTSSRCSSSSRSRRASR